MDLQQEFEKAVSESKLLPEKPSNEILLKLYSLFKQANEGDFNGEFPSNPFDFVGKAKAEAWQNQTGKQKDAAMKEYIELVKQLKGE